jgi:RHS repeat-associated protein
MDSYRYGFQGMEGDNEVKGIGNSYTTEFRQFDSRIGRWQTIDRLSRKQPSLSPYNFVNNNPIFRIDQDGLEDFTINRKGEIKSTGKGLDCDTDRLIAGKAKYNENGDLKNSKRKIKEVEKGALSNIHEVSSDTENSHFFKIEDKTNAEEVFKFISKNTAVEHSLTTFVDETGEQKFSAISTSSEFKGEGGAWRTMEYYSQTGGFVPSSHTHDHKTGLDDNGHHFSGFPVPSTEGKHNDMNFKSRVNGEYLKQLQNIDIDREIQFNIYHPYSNTFNPY